MYALYASNTKHLSMMKTVSLIFDQSSTTVMFESSQKVNIKILKIMFTPLDIS
jgi:hypothetical protein